MQNKANYLSEAEKLEFEVREELFRVGQIQRISRTLMEYERRSKTNDPFFDVPSREVLVGDLKDGFYRLVERRIPVAEIKRYVEAHLMQQDSRYTSTMEVLVDCAIDDLFD